MTFKIKQGFGLLLLCLFFSTQALAESDAEAEKWLKKLIDIYQQGPVTFEMAADMAVNQNGTNMDMKLNGNIIYASTKKMRMNMTMALMIPNQPEPMKMEMAVVMDGVNMWSLVKNPMMGGEQVMRLTLATLEKVSKDKLAQMGLNNIDMFDPTKMMENLSKFMNLSFEGIEAGKVHLSAEMTEEYAKTLGMEAAELGQGGSFDLVLDEKNIFPFELNVKIGDAANMKMTFQNLKHLKSDELDETSFSFTPPEGVQVMDLDAMLTQE